MTGRPMRCGRVEMVGVQVVSGSMGRMVMGRGLVMVHMGYSESLGLACSRSSPTLLVHGQVGP